MIHHKKIRWERQRQELDNKLQHREQELINLKNSIEQKNSQIEHFKKLLANMEKTSGEVMNKYEQEIRSLHDQLTRLKSDYVKIQRRYKNRQENGASGKPLAQISINCPSSTSSSSSATNSSISLSPPALKRQSSSAISSTLNSALKNRNQPPIFAPISPKTTDEKHSSGSKKLKTNTISDNRDNLEGEVERLRKQLDEQKAKEANLYKERDKLNKLNEHYRNKNSELIKKIDEMNKKADEPEGDKLAHTDKLNIEFYKQEVKKRDDYIK